MQKKKLQFAEQFFYFWNIARGLHDSKKIEFFLMNLAFAVMAHTYYCLFNVIYICTFSLKKWRWSKNGLHGSWENSGKTSLRSVEKILSSPSLARNRPCVYCQIQTRRARWGGSTVSGKQIRCLHNDNTSFFKFLRGSSSALKKPKIFSLGLAPRSSASNPVQSSPSRIHRWRKAGEIPRLFASQLVRQPLPYQCIRAWAGPLFSQLCQLAW